MKRFSLSASLSRSLGCGWTKLRVMWGRPYRLVTATYRKWRLMPSADQIGVAIGLGSLLVGGMAVVLTVVSLRMAARQGEIAEMQLDILNRQLQREANITVLIHSEAHRSVVATLVNDGVVSMFVDRLVLVLTNDDIESVACSTLTAPQTVLATTRGETSFNAAAHVTTIDGPFTIPAESEVRVVRCTFVPLRRSGVALIEWTVSSVQRSFRRTDSDSQVVTWGPG